MNGSRIRNMINYFPTALKQGKYTVIPPAEVPKEIKYPPYRLTKNPVFGLYKGNPIVHSASAILKLRKSAAIASHVLQKTQEWVYSQSKNELSEQDIDRYVFKSIIQNDAYPTPIGFMGFPKSVCISTNQCIVHGIPSTRPIQLGDKLNIDVTIYYDGYHGDTNLTLFYGQARHQHFIDVRNVTQNALYNAISLCGPKVKFNQIGKCIQQYVKKQHMYVCEHFTGHGVGQFLHMPPQVYHTYEAQMSTMMLPGHVFTIEPIITLKPLDNLAQWNDGFTIISHNNPNAQFEHTILITDDGCEVLTQRDNEKIPNPNNNIKNIKNI